MNIKTPNKKYTTQKVVFTQMVIFIMFLYLIFQPFLEAIDKLEMSDRNFDL